MPLETRRRSVARVARRNAAECRGVAEILLKSPITSGLLRQRSHFVKTGPLKFAQLGYAH